MLTFFYTITVVYLNMYHIYLAKIIDIPEEYFKQMQTNCSSLKNNSSCCCFQPCPISIAWKYEIHTCKTSLTAITQELSTQRKGLITPITECFICLKQFWQEFATDWTHGHTDCEKDGEQR